MGKHADEQQESNTAVAEPPAKNTSQKPSATKPKQRSKQNQKKLPPYVLIVENDDFHSYPYVIEVLQRICRLKLQDAIVKTIEVDKKGESVVWSGTKELAELKRDQIRGYGPDTYPEITVRFPLGVRIEPVAGSGDDND